MSGHDDVTLQLAKKEQKEHLGPEMASLLNDMTNRDIIVAASPLDSSPPETPGYTTLKSKTVHFIRHGQGFHNLLADSYRSEGKTWTQYTNHPSNPYVKPEITDAPLTHKGRLQATSLQPLTSTLPVDLVVVSPQNRATHTALLAFSHLLPSPPFSSPPSVPFVAHESVREETGVHVCDKRRSVTLARSEFPYVDYSLIESDEDPMFTEEGRETKGQIGERIYDFIMWLKDREEGNVAVASHSGWLMTLFNGVVICGEELKPWFMTGELRSVKIEWRIKN
ncbi:hypothetical protein TrVE_jg8757 [Triparma verrucosa]|uniref:Phosphoglycerate mutase-like protein n=1 Tax=Triparma verrucosa TaxID=1606542 RepID=A0A9W7DSA6_9STRA|nr:hypothetical protein TrVE_jg8757 [Triparma verrucosa]